VEAHKAYRLSAAAARDSNGDRNGDSISAAVARGSASAFAHLDATTTATPTTTTAAAATTTTVRNSTTATTPAPAYAPLDTTTAPTPSTTDTPAVTATSNGLNGDSNGVSNGKSDGDSNGSSNHQASTNGDHYHAPTANVMNGDTHSNDTASYNGNGTHTVLQSNGYGVTETPPEAPTPPPDPELYDLFAVTKVSRLQHNCHSITTFF
jgi:hypothetical protein